MISTDCFGLVGDAFMAAGATKSYRNDFVVYVSCKSKVPVQHVKSAQQIKSSLWLIAFYAPIMLFSGWVAAVAAL